MKFCAFRQSFGSGLSGLHRCFGNLSSASAIGQATRVNRENSHPSDNFRAIFRAVLMINRRSNRSNMIAASKTPAMINVKRLGFFTKSPSFLLFSTTFRPWAAA